MSELSSVLVELDRDESFRRNVTRWERIAARDARHAPIPSDLHPRLAGSFAERGIDKLYSHQRESYDAVQEGRDIVVVTPTASGKTLCYNLPVLQTILEAPDSRALYMFPTKALSQDQQSELNEVLGQGEIPVKVATYDGDTPDSLRMKVRDTGQIVITNPDMLHTGILPNHPKWISFLKNLRFVIIDELHSYRGVFGSHVAHVVRRLRRICRFYGSSPVFICSSATIGNPKELAESITGKPMQLVDNNGAPSGEKHLVLYNPPLVDRVQGIRRGVVNESQNIALRLLKAGIKTIVFTRSRVRTELVASYIRRSLANMYTDNERIRVESYRGGYLPNERRAIERGLRGGDIQGVVSTNALELGIDIGGLDAAVLAGLPGSISSSWQQAGRAGRRNSLSVAIMIASSAPMDQYMVRHPGYFFGRNPERAFVDPDNLYVLTDHLKCAVFELPVSDEHPYEGADEDHLGLLEEGGVVRFSNGAWYWADRSYPSEGISLRSATADNVVIIDTTQGRHDVIAELHRRSAKEMIFTNAIYLHLGNQYVVTELDLDNRRCYVEESRVNYYTDALVKRDIKVLHHDSDDSVAGLLGSVADVLVRTQVSKFKKLRFHTHENIGFGEISLPEEQMHTRSVVIRFPQDSPAGTCLAALEEDMQGPVIGRLGTLLRNVAPVFLLCERSDIGVAERIRDPHYGQPAIYLYDNGPGGTGLAEQFLSVFPPVLAAAHQLLSDCPCREGCPSCIGPRDEQEEVSGNPKTALLQLLGSWRGAAES